MTPHNEISLRPAAIYAFARSLPLILVGLAFLALAWWLAPLFLLPAIVLIAVAWYRFLRIRSFRYLLTSEILRVSKGLFFRRTDQVELFRMKDFIITQPLFMRLFRIMNLTLKSTDPELPVVTLQGIPESDIVDAIREYVLEARKHNQLIELN